MALNLLPLLFGGFAAKTAIDRGLAQRDRDTLAEGVQGAFGVAPGAQLEAGANVGQARAPGAPAIGQVGAGMQINPDGSIGPPPTQAGIFPSAVSDPRQMIQQASQLFALPGGQQLGESLIGDAFEFAQRNQEQQLQFKQQNYNQAQGQVNALEQQQNLFQQQDLLQENRQEFQGVQNAATREQQQQQFNEQQRWREQVAQQKLALEAAAEGYTLDAQGNPVAAPFDPNAPTRVGSVPAGFAEYPLPGGGSYLAAAPGSEPYIKAQTILETNESAITLIDDQIESIKASGSELVGPESKRQGINYRNIVAAIGELQNLGVLQEAEAERLEDSLPDPSSITGATTSNESMIAAYQQLQASFQKKLAYANQKYSAWGLGSMLSQATPQQMREAELEAQQAAAAQQLGLTVDNNPAPRPVQPDLIPGNNLEILGAGLGALGLFGD